MNTKVLLAALAGAVVSFLSGWVIYGMLLKGFFDANTMETARSVVRGDDSMVFWALFLGCLAWSSLLALVFSRWAGISTFKAGAIGGAWVMFLAALGANLFSFASLDVTTIQAALVDSVVNAVQGVLVGGTVGWVLGYGGGK